MPENGEFSLSFEFLNVFLEFWREIFGIFEFLVKNIFYFEEMGSRGGHTGPRKKIQLFLGSNPKGS